MSWCDRRGALLLVAGALAGCGFRPLYGDGGGARALLGAVMLQEAVSPEDFAYRERLRRRLGLEGAGSGAAGASRQLNWTLEFKSTGVAVTSDADTTRYRLIASAAYRLDSSDGSTPPIEDKVKVIGGYDATASPFATRTAAEAERRDLSVELAELTATRLLAAAARQSE